jgi:GT2 family glycosyltransferase
MKADEPAGDTGKRAASEAVTTVVVTRNRWPDLRRSLAHHTGPVIVVDNASDDGTAQRVAEDFPHVRVIELAENRGAVGRNVGVEAARTPYVAFADDDSWWAPGALDLAVERFDAHPRLGLLAARTLVGEDERLDPICAQMAMSPLPRQRDLPGPSVLGFQACGAVVRRDAYLQAGGFDDVVQFAGEEERLALDLAARGWGLAYVDRVVTHHHPSMSRDSSAARAATVARNRVLTSLMRRPWSVVAGTTRAVLVEGLPGARGVLRAIPRVPRALRARQLLPPHVERDRSRLGV